MPDKFSAVWVSHTSISDFIKCPRAYYLKNIYRNPATNRKLQLMTPALALGQAVHEVIESLSVLPTKNRFKESLLDRYKKVWSKKVSGKLGGFLDPETESRYYSRGESMLQRVMKHPGPLANLAVKIKEDLPHYWLSETDGIILCGKVDWLEYLPDTDSVHIIDFKTGKAQEDSHSLQLPIYHVLVHNTQHRQVSKASYWYLAQSDELEEKTLPDLDQAHDQILEVAKKLKLARQLEVFKCPHGGDCFACKDFERLVRGEGELVGQNEYGQEVYILPDAQETQMESEVL